MDHAYLTASRKKLGEIYADLSHNVTRIYNRVPVHLAFDLVAHSVLGFTFKGQRVQRGWVEGLLVGDTRVGKSQIAERLAGHYGLGRHVNCERVSFAGLVGGMQQIGKTWNINWGIIPLFDRQMVTLDEASGLTTEQISQMSGLRSGGVAEIVKIQQERTWARCRLLWIMNRRKEMDNRMEDLSYGVKAVPEGMGRVEDIARLDFALCMSQSDVPAGVVNAKERPAVDARFTPDRCHNLLLWAWSRREEEVVWAPETEDFILDQATALSSKYSPEIPIVERSEQRIRLARLSCAMAARLFSTDDLGKKLLVRQEHVQLVLDFLTSIYNHAAMRYDRFSQSRNHVSTYSDESLDLCVDRLRRYNPDTLGSMVMYLSENEDLNKFDMAEATGWDMDSVRQFFQLFSSKSRGLRPAAGGRVIKTPLMAAALKRMEG